MHQDVAAEFAEKLAARMGGLTLGRGQDDGVDVGPLIDEDAVESVARLVTDAVHGCPPVLVEGRTAGCFLFRLQYFFFLF